MNRPDAPRKIQPAGQVIKNARVDALRRILRSQFFIPGVTRHGNVSALQNRLFLHWRGRQKKPRHKTTSDFFSATNAEHHRYALRRLHVRHPNFSNGFADWPWLERHFR